MTELEKLRHDLERHQTSLASAEAEVDRLRERIQDAELALNVWDQHHESEYWLRHQR